MLHSFELNKLCSVWWILICIYNCTVAYNSHPLLCSGNRCLFYVTICNNFGICVYFVDGWTYSKLVFIFW